MLPSSICYNTATTLKPRSHWTRQMKLTLKSERSHRTRGVASRIASRRVEIKFVWFSGAWTRVDARWCASMPPTRRKATRRVRCERGLSHKHTAVNSLGNLCHIKIILVQCLSGWWVGTVAVLTDCQTVRYATCSSLSVLRRPVRLPQTSESETCDDNVGDIVFCVKSGTNSPAAQSVRPLTLSSPLHCSLCLQLVEISLRFRP